LILGKTKDFYARLALILMLLVLVIEKKTEFGKHFILNSTEIKLRGEKNIKID